MGDFWLNRWLTSKLRQQLRQQLAQMLAEVKVEPADETVMGDFWLKNWLTWGLRQLLRQLGDRRAERQGPARPDNKVTSHITIKQYRITINLS